MLYLLFLIFIILISWYTVWILFLKEIPIFYDIFIGNDKEKELLLHKKWHTKIDAKIDTKF